MEFRTNSKEIAERRAKKNIADVEQIEEKTINPLFEKAKEILTEKKFVRYTVEGSKRFFHTTRMKQLVMDENKYGITCVVE